MTDASPPPVFTDNPMNPLEVSLYEGMADHTKMGLFERLMLENDLFAVPEPGSPGATPGDDGAKVLNPGEQMILRGLLLEDGRKTIAVFTDPRRAVMMFGDDTRVIAMKGRALLGMFKGATVLLNPADGRALIMGPDQIAAVLSHEAAPVTYAPRPTGSVELTELPVAQHPIVLIKRLLDGLADVDIKAAWLAKAQWMEAAQIGWYLDIRTDAASDEVHALVTRAISGLSFGGEVFDLSVTKPGGEDGIGIKIV
ncbi:SseB family protein [Brevundimonas lenta]|uniref:SseB protein N-terminal domain-containing protein n=1 Tax=Brevundimonas lenta TaxID=424796 RepID=A0A7W6JBI1_9CAUL|nr:SseB family protein [Brevundimonas lenta]MBB4082075.1 hypothetical protein [Brevundimonas lenta]